MVPLVALSKMIANTVDFGASDAPLADDKRTQEGLFQFPTVIGGVVLAVQPAWREILASWCWMACKPSGDIYLGKN